MASDVRTKILDIQVRTKDALDQIAKYRKEVAEAMARQKELKKELNDGAISEEEYGRQVEASRIFIMQQNQAINTLTRQLNNQEKAQAENLGSLVQWRAELSNLTAEYDKLSQAEREGARGEELKAHINELTTKLKEAEQGTQRFFRNVGNYPNAMGQAATAVEGLIDALSKECKTAEEAEEANDILRRALAGIDPSAEGAADAIEALNKKIEENNEVIAEHENQSAELVDSLGDLVGVNTKFGSSLENLSKNSAGSFIDGLNTKAKALWQTLKGLLSNPAILTFLGIGGAVMAFKGLYDYNQNLVEATKQTKQFTGLAGDELKHLRNEIQATADTYGKDFTEMLTAVNNLAQQFGITHQEALQLVQDGFIAGADANGQYLDNLSEFPAYFKEAGVSANQFIALISQANSMGIVSNKALDTIKEANLRLREMSDTTSKSLSAIGLDATKIQKELANGTTTTFEVIQQVSQKLDSLPANSKVVGEAIANIFGGPGQDAGYQYLTTLHEISLNLDEIKAKTSEEAAVEQELIEARTNLANALSDVFDMTGGTFETVTAKIKIGLLNTLTSLLKGIKSVVDYVKQWKTVFMAIGATIITVTAAVNAHNIALALTWAKTKLVAAAQGVMNGVMATGKAAVLLLSAAYNACTGNLGRASAAMKVFNTVCKSNPFGLILTVISAAIAAIELFGSKTEEAKAKVNAMANAEEAATRVKTKATRAVENDIKALENWHGTKKEEKKICDELNTKYGSVLGKYSTVGAWYMTLKTKGTEYIQMLYEQAKAEALVAQAAELRAEAARKRLEGQNADVSWFDQFNHLLEINLDTFEIRANTWSQSGENLKQYAAAEANAAAAQLEQIAAEMEKQAEESFSKSNEKALDYLNTLSDMESVLDTVNKKNTVTPTTTTTDTKTNKSSSGKSPEETEKELLRKAEDELLKITQQSVETRRKVLALSYDRQIEDYRKKLKEEETLTEESRKAILSIIDSLEKQKAQAVAAFNAEELKKQVEHDAKLLELKLAAVEQGSKEELDLRLDKLKKQEELELAQAEVEYKNEEEKQQALVAIREKYKKQEDAAQEAYKTEVCEKQKVVLQNEIEQLDIAETEKQLHREGWRTMTDEEMEADRQRKLESIGGYEAEKLQLEEENAQKAYEALMERGQLSTQTDAEWLAEQNAAKQEWLNKQVAINEAYVKNEQAKQQAVRAVTNGLVSLLETLGDENSAFAKMAKVITLAQIAIDTGRALSSGIASASALPFPANLAAIATTVATVLANVATAISTVKSAKFATGGKVNGPGTGTSDSIPAMLSNGEYVMTARATKMFEPVLAAMNSIGSGVPIQVANSYESVDNAEMLTDSFSQAAREIKPVVSVVEITEAQDRVDMIENLDNF